MRKPYLTALALGSLAFVQVDAGQPSRQDVAIRIVRLDPAFDRLVPRDARVEKVADGFQWVEGPVWDGARARLLFSDVPANAIYAWTEQAGPMLFLKPSGYTGSAPFVGQEPGSNGLALDTGGRLILAQHGDRRIVRIEPDGRRVTIADRFRGRRLNSPNDVILARNGDLLFTDPPFGLPDGFSDPPKELSFSGVYRRREVGTLELLTTALPAPNGLALSPDERTLYVSNADRNHPVWLAFDVRADGTLGASRTFYDLRGQIDGRPGAPDGLKVDRNGNVFAGGPGGVYVLSADGRLLGRVDLGVATANVAWGDDGSALYIAASTAIYRVGLTTGR
jgi:gluconolactonase